MDSPIESLRVGEFPPDWDLCRTRTQEPTSPLVPESQHTIAGPYGTGIIHHVLSLPSCSQPRLLYRGLCFGGVGQEHPLAPACPLQWNPSQQVLHHLPGKEYDSSGMYIFPSISPPQRLSMYSLYSMHAYYVLCTVHLIYLFCNIRGSVL